jgi:hypothetical protein
MTRWMAMAVLTSGCSLLVPGNDGFTPDRVDAGAQSERDAGRERDAGPRDSGTDLAHCGACDNACAATDLCRDGACFDPAVEVAAGPEHTCVRRASGQVWCWGSNVRGQLGEGTVIDSPIPVRVADVDRAVEIAASGFAWRTPDGGSCARHADGTVTCWGQLMEGASPVRVDGLAPARSITVSSSTSGCAVTTTNQLWCWGWDEGTMMLRPAAELQPLGIGGAWAIAGRGQRGSHVCDGRVLPHRSDLLLGEQPRRAARRRDHDESLEPRSRG